MKTPRVVALPFIDGVDCITSIISNQNGKKKRITVTTVAPIVPYLADDAVDDAVIVDAVIGKNSAGHVFYIITYHACYNSIYFGSMTLTFDLLP